eukprot:jgi/Mesvir1/2394/Mv22138-RA.1
MASTLSVSTIFSLPKQASNVAFQRRSLAVRAEKPKEFCRDQVNVPGKRVDPEESTAETVKVTFLGANNSSTVLNCPKDSYILDAALKSDLDLPWSCRGAICGVCVGKVTKGSVDMSDIEDLTFTLDQEQIDEGMALLCMARPVGDVTIETQCDWGYMLGLQEWKGATGNIGGTVAKEWKSMSDVEL